MDIVARPIVPPQLMDCELSGSREGRWPRQFVAFSGRCLFLLEPNADVGRENRQFKRTCPVTKTLSIVAQHRGFFDEAVDWYRKALRIDEELDNRDHVAASYHQLGMVAQELESYPEAVDWYRKSLQIAEKLGNRAGMASTYHQLGSVAHARGSYDEALDWYGRSFQIKKELGDRAGMAAYYNQLGIIQGDLGKPAEGVPCVLQSLAIHLEIRSPYVRKNLDVLKDQRESLGEQRFRALVTEHAGEGGLEGILGLMARVEASRSRDSSD